MGADFLVQTMKKECVRTEKVFWFRPEFSSKGQIGRAQRVPDLPFGAKLWSKGQIGRAQRVPVSEERRRMQGVSETVGLKGKFLNQYTQEVLAREEVGERG